MEDTVEVRPRPLSSAQLPIWHAEILHRNTPRWTQITVLRFTGSVDAERLARAIQAIVQRHPALRTRLGRQRGEAWQIFEPEASFQLRQHGGPVVAEAQESEITAFLRWAHCDRFDMRGGALFRADLRILSDDRAVLALRLHHIAADGVALALLVPQIAAVYRGEEPRLGQDRAYEEWLDRQEAAAYPGLEEANSFYSEELAGVPLPCETIYDRPDDTLRFEPPDLLEVTRIVEPVHCDSLRVLARNQGATLFIVLFAAFAATLRDFTKQDDLLIATFVSGRAGEPKPIVGSCINTLLVRVRVKAGDFVAMIEALKQAWRPVRRHQSVPSILVRDRDGHALPLAQFAINFLDMTETSFEAPGLTTSITHAQQGFPLNDVLLYALREQNGSLRLRLIAGSGTPRLSLDRLDQISQALVQRINDWSVDPVSLVAERKSLPK